MKLIVHKAVKPFTVHFNNGLARFLCFVVALWGVLQIALIQHVLIMEHMIAHERSDAAMSRTLEVTALHLFIATSSSSPDNREHDWLAITKLRTDIGLNYPKILSQTSNLWQKCSQSLNSSGKLSYTLYKEIESFGHTVTATTLKTIQKQNKNVDLYLILDVVLTPVWLFLISLLSYLRGKADQHPTDDKFHLLFEQSSDAHLLFDDTGIIDCNLAAIRMLNCTEKSHVLSLHPAVLSPEFQPDGTRSLEKCIEMDAIATKNGYHRFEWYHQKVDGTIFPVEVTLTPVSILNKEAMLVVWHDLTERKIAEEKVKQSEKMLRDMVENLPAGAIYVDGENILVNRAVEEITGYTREELPTLQVWFQTMFKEKASHVRSKYETEKAAGFPGSPVVTLTRKDGEIRHVQFTAYAYDGGEVWILHDISERIEATRALNESKIRLAEAQRIAHLGSYEVIFDTGEVIWSEEVYRLFDRDISEGTPTFEEVLQQYHPDDLAELNASRERGCKTEQAYEQDLRVRQKDGSYRWCRSISKPILDSNGKPLRTIGTLLDINERKLDQQRIEAANSWLEDANSKLLHQQEAMLITNHQLEEQMRLVNEQAAALEAQKLELEQVNERLQALATMDGLTGVANHRACQERLMEEWNRSCRYMEPFSIILLDVDNFKAYNDQFGHPEGDTVLRTVADILTQSIRDVDFVARYGGEEFVILLPLTDIEGACKVAERCRKSLETAYWKHRKVTASFGVATKNIHSNSAQEMVDFADKALYTTKRSGRNGVTHYQLPVETIFPEIEDVLYLQ